MWYEYLLKQGMVPETFLRFGIRRKLKHRIKADPSGNDEISYLNSIYNTLNRAAIAIHTDTANEQHYELPSDFFQIILGPRLKYSCCLYEQDNTDLENAEKLMLELTVDRASIVDGTEILDLGCGWGSLTLYLAEKFPNSNITALSNSSTQRRYIEDQAEKAGFDNINVVTGNIATIELDHQFDHIVSIEMFEHMRNYRKLFAKLVDWLNPEGTLFVHMFARHGSPYLFEDDGSFMSAYFFSGGTMLNVDDLPRFAQDHFSLVDDWEIVGTHYEKTLEMWLSRMKTHKSQLIPILKETYGDDFKQWWEYWKIFFIVCAELFGYNNGNEWVVKHYLFQQQ